MTINGYRISCRIYFEVEAEYREEALAIVQKDLKKIEKTIDHYDGCNDYQSEAITILPKEVI